MAKIAVCAIAIQMLVLPILFKIVMFAAAVELLYTASKIVSNRTTQCEFNQNGTVKKLTFSYAW